MFLSCHAPFYRGQASAANVQRSLGLDRLESLVREGEIGMVHKQAMYSKGKMAAGMKLYLAAPSGAPYPICGVSAGSAVLGRVAIAAAGRVHGAWPRGFCCPDGAIDAP